MSLTSALIGAATPVAFLTTTDPARARAFYRDLIGLSLVSEDGFALVFDLGPLALRVTRVQELAPQPFTVLGWQVEDVLATASALGARGVVFERFAALEQDPAGVWTAPSGTRLAWFKDPDGNILSISQHPAD